MKFKFTPFLLFTTLFIGVYGYSSSKKISNLHSHVTLKKESAKNFYNAILGKKIYFKLRVEKSLDIHKLLGLNQDNNKSTTEELAEAYLKSFKEQFPEFNFINREADADIVLNMDFFFIFHDIPYIQISIETNTNIITIYQDFMFRGSHYSSLNYRNYKRELDRLKNTLARSIMWIKRKSHPKKVKHLSSISIGEGTAIFLPSETSFRFNLKAGSLNYINNQYLIGFGAGISVFRYEKLNELEKEKFTYLPITLYLPLYLHDIYERTDVIISSEFGLFPFKNKYIDIKLYLKKSMEHPIPIGSHIFSVGIGNKWYYKKELNLYLFASLHLDLWGTN